MPSFSSNTYAVVTPQWAIPISLSLGDRGNTFHIYISAKYGPPYGVSSPFGTIYPFTHTSVLSLVGMIFGKYEILP